MLRLLPSGRSCSLAPRRSTTLGYSVTYCRRFLRGNPMRSQTSHRNREHRMMFGPPRRTHATSGKLLPYWPTDLDLHNRQVMELRNDPAERWCRYLRSLPERKLAVREAAAAAERLWILLTEEMNVTPPNASPTDDGGILMSWTEHGHHLEIEINTTGTYDWFYRHRASDTTDSGIVEDETITPQVIMYLNRVLR